MKYWVGAGGLALILTVAGCGTQDMSTEQEPEEAAVEDETTETVEQPEAEAETEDSTGGDSHDDEVATVDPYDYFLEDGSTARFEGYGNEFAEFTLRTDYMEANHVATYEDNGGTVGLKVFRLHDDRIELVKQEGEFYEDFEASFEELQALEVISTYLEFPIEQDQEIGDATVVETGASLETPYRNFEDNGGTVGLKVFRLHDDRIELVKQEGEFYEDFEASFEELQALEVISTYLEFPIEQDQEIGDATVVETGASLETPYRNFEDVFVLEQESEGSINRNYFVEGFGEVKREFRANPDDPEEFWITSTLASIELAEKKK